MVRQRTFDAPTPAQSAAWPAIAAQRHVLIAAPTGLGKTLAAFLAVIDELVARRCRQREGCCRIRRCGVCVALKALSNDIHRNPRRRSPASARSCARLGLPEVDIRTFVRTGDTPQRERVASAKRPPHIVVTTLSRLYILLGSESGRRMLRAPYRDRG